jgi:hypothetical protein
MGKMFDTIKCLAGCIDVRAILVAGFDFLLSHTFNGRSPDYLVLDLSGGGSGFNGGGELMITRDGSILVAPEAGIGSPGFGVSYRAGWIPGPLPAPGATDAEVSGFSWSAEVNGPMHTPSYTLTNPFALSDLSSAFDSGIATEAGVTLYGGMGVSFDISYAIRLGTIEAASWRF